MSTKAVNKNQEGYTIYVGRGSKFGNPYTHKELEKTKASVKCKSRKEAINKFKLWIYGIEKIEGLTPPSYEEIVNELKGQILGCFCLPKECHATFLAEVAEMTKEQFEMNKKILEAKKVEDKFLF